MPKRHIPARERWMMDQVPRLLVGLSNGNRRLGEAFVQEELVTSAPSTAYQHLVRLSHVDEWLNGQPIPELKAEKWRDLMLHLSKHGSRGVGFSPAILSLYAGTIRSCLRLAANSEYLPRDILRALKPKVAMHRSPRRVVTREEFDAILAVVAEFSDPSKRLCWEGLLWVLWDAGFRKEEALSLRRSAVEFTGPNTAVLHLRPHDHGLKTGARSPPVVECVPALRAWLSFEPGSGDLDEYLFPARDGASAKKGDVLNVAIHRYCDRAGVRRFHPHLLRHTRATRMAEAGAREADLREYFGWGPSSPMPAYYVHLAENRLANLVQQEAGIDPVTAKPQMQTGLKWCHACAEPIKVAAAKCKHCGEWIKPKEQFHD